MNQNFSQLTTAAIGNSTGFGPGSTSPQRPHNTFLLSCLVVIALATQACRQDYPTMPLSSTTLSAETVSLSASAVRTSRDSLATYTYMAEETIEPAEPTAVMPATGSVKLNPERLLTLAGVVDSRMFALANRLVELAESSSKPIDIVISSPGGSVSHGLYLVEAIKAAKARGIVIRCHVPTLAASMAFVIFTQCSERYALPYAQLLFHAPRVSGQFVITPQTAIQLAKGLISIQNVLFGLIVPVMGVNEDSAEWFMENYLNETLWTADELNRSGPVTWFTVVAHVKGYPGEFPAAYDKTVRENRKASLPDIREVGL